jgi:serine/threonine protein kinase
LTSDHQHLKIQDFNRAEIMLWNEDDQDYCRYLNGPGHGEVSQRQNCTMHLGSIRLMELLLLSQWRSPEEYHDKPLNEKIDVWSLGTSMYSMLTGLLPFYDVESGSEVRRRVRKGKTPYIDPRYKNRSRAERKMVEAIERCWEYDPDERIDIFGVVKILREGVDAL